MARHTVLIIEDEPSLVDVVSFNLENEGYEVLTASDGRTGLQRAFASLPDLIVLDLMLPVVDGLEVCRQLRSDSRTAGVRIIMLTAKSEEIDEVVGLQMGADDYVKKPFGMKALMQRVKTLLKRPVETETGTSSDVVSRHGITVDRISHTVQIESPSGETELIVTPTEFRLLWTFLRQPGRTFTRSELMDASRGEDANSTERTIDVHIRSLRQKLGEKADLIETVRGVGYRMATE